MARSCLQVVSSSSSVAVALLVVALTASWTVPGGEAHPNYSSNKTLLCTTMEPGHGISAQPDAEFSKFFKLSGKEGTHKDFIGEHHFKNSRSAVLS